MPATILVVDDEEGIVQLARLYLDREGFRVHTARDGQEGLEAARRLKPDLIVLDLMMPRMDGWEVYRRLRTARCPSSCSPPAPTTWTRSWAWSWGRTTTSPSPSPPRAGGPGQGHPARVQARPIRTPCWTWRTCTSTLPAREVLVGGEPVQLRAQEFELLLVLMQSEGRVMTREALLSRAWGYEYTEGPAPWTSTSPSCGRSSRGQHPDPGRARAGASWSP